MFSILRTVASVLIVVIAVLYVNIKTGFGDKDFVELTQDYGYNSTAHVVTTVDGYHLTIFRMDKGKNCKRKVVSTPVLLIPGLFQISEGFIDAGPNAGLAYLLADACYDVWVGNNRGNYHGRRHTTLDPDKDEEFWNFSADEFSLCDLPAKINYILNISKSSKMNIIGYSQSGTTPFLMCAEKTDYCEKLGVIISISPASRLTDTKSLILKGITKFAAYNEDLLREVGIYELFPRHGIIQTLAESLCEDGIIGITRFICRRLTGMIDGHNPGSITDETFRLKYKHFPAGTSIKNMVRYSQIMKSGIIRKYDYGEKVNLEKYGQVKPPIYDLREVKVPVVIIHGKNDLLTVVEDSKWVVGEVPNSKLIEVKDPLWNHFDMLYSQHINRTIFSDINKILLKYN